LIDSGSAGAPNVDHRAVDRQQREVGADVERSADGIDDQVESAGQLLEGARLAGGVVGVRSEAQSVVPLLQ
jgi:hypothetical protein